MSGPFDKELSSLRSSNKPSYTKSSHDPDGKKLEGHVKAAEGGGYQLKSHVDTDSATEIKHRGGDHIVRAYRNKATSKLHVTHSMDYAASPNRARPTREETDFPKYPLDREEPMTVKDTTETPTFEAATQVIDATIRGNSAMATQGFSDLVAQRAAELIDARRSEMQKTVFASPAEPEEAPEVEVEAEDEVTTEA